MEQAKNKIPARTVALLLPLALLCQILAALPSLWFAAPFFCLLGCVLLAYLYSTGCSAAVLLTAPVAAAVSFSLAHSPCAVVVAFTAGAGALAIGITMRRGQKKIVSVWACAAATGLVLAVLLLLWFYRHVGTPTLSAFVAWGNELLSQLSEKIVALWEQVSSAAAVSQNVQQSLTQLYSKENIEALLWFFALRIPGFLGAMLFVYGWLCICGVRLLTRLCGRGRLVFDEPYRVDVSKAGAVFYIIAYTVSMLFSMVSADASATAIDAVTSNFMLFLLPGLFLVGCRTIRSALRHPAFRRFGVFALIAVCATALFSVYLSAHLLVLVALTRILFYPPRFLRPGGDL